MSDNLLSALEAEICIEEAMFGAIFAEVKEKEEIINDAIDTSNKLDNVQSLVIECYNNELSSTSKKCINLTLETICNNLGANPDKFFDVLSLENLEGNKYQQVALENTSVFIKELWIKIKNSIEELWNKVADFWNDNFASLNKIKKSLETILLQISGDYKVTQPIKTNYNEKSLLSSFSNKSNDIDAKTIEGFIIAHFNSFNSLDDLVKYTKQFNIHVKSMNDSDFESEMSYILDHLCKNFIGRTFRFGSENSPMIGGHYTNLEFTSDEDTNDLTISSEIEQLDFTENRNIWIIEKNKLQVLIKKTIDIIKETIKYKEAQEALQKEFVSLTNTYDKHIEKNSLLNDYDQINGNKTNLLINYKKTIRLIYRINSNIPKIFGMVILSNVKLARSIVSYSNFCLRHA